MRLHACTRTDEHEERRGAGHILELVAGDDARGEEGRDHAGGQAEGEADHAAGLFVLILFGCDLRGVGLLSRQGSVETVGLVEFYFISFVTYLRSQEQIAISALVAPWRLRVLNLLVVAPVCMHRFVFKGFSQSIPCAVKERWVREPTKSGRRWMKECTDATPTRTHQL